MSSPAASPEAVRVLPGMRGAEVVVVPPADKSIAQRLLIMSLLCRGETVIRGAGFGADCHSTAAAVEALGAQVQLDRSGTTMRVRAPEGIAPRSREIYLGNSGTGMRLLAGLVAGYPVEVVLTGDDSLMRRPMTRVAVPLRRMGAEVELLGAGGRPPLRVRGGRLKGIRYELPVASAQVKSCILLAGLAAEGETAVREPGPSRDHTERLLQVWGAPLTCAGEWIRLRGYGGPGPYFPARRWDVPGDFSSAAYFLALGAGAPGRAVTVRSVGLNPRRSGFLEILAMMGARIVRQEGAAGGDWEPVGWVRVEGQRLTGVEVAGSLIPGVIDELPLIAVLGAIAEGVTVIRDAAELRVKECDRIAAVAEGLRRLGVEVEEFNDGLAVTGRGELRNAETEIETFGDHRIAMSFAVLASYASAPLIVKGAGCAEVSCPDFWRTLVSCGMRVESA